MTSGIPLPPREFMDAVAGERTEPETHIAIGAHVFDLVRDTCHTTPSSNILDLGSGCGRVATQFTAYLTDGEYHGIDIVLPMVEWCHDNITSRFPRFQFHHAYLSNTLYSKTGADASSYVFPFEDGKFDVVFAASVFTHLLPASARQYAHEIHRVLKPGGRGLLTFFITDPSPEAASRAKIQFIPVEGYSVTDPSNSEAVIAYDEGAAREILKGAGLTIEMLSPGQWRGNEGVTFQDAFLVSKA